MSNCKYCGKPAGLFRSKHVECEKQHQQRECLIQEQQKQRERVIDEGRKKIINEIVRTIKSAQSFDELEKTIVEIEQSTFVPSAERKVLLAKGWEASVEQFLEDGVLNAKEEERLVNFKVQFALSQEDLDINGAFTKTTKTAVLRDILNGTIPRRAKVEGGLPINFQPGEQVVWAFPGSEYLEDKTRREYVGGSQGVSMRLMKGLYYRVGAFKGKTVEHTERVHIDTGWVVVTNKNIYFTGPQKSVRLPYAKIVTFTPFSDGIGIMRDTTTAKLQIFVTGDGWFTYNLVSNLARNEMQATSLKPEGGYNLVSNLAHDETVQSTPKSATGTFGSQVGKEIMQGVVRGFIGDKKR